MSSRQQLQVTVVSLVLVAFLGGALALAAQQKNITYYKGSCALTPALGSDEPGASGDATATESVVHRSDGTYFSNFDATVNCTGLTPGATYHVMYVGTGTADGNGSLTITGGRMWSASSPYIVRGIDVFRVNANQEVLVLSGIIGWMRVKKL